MRKCSFWLKLMSNNICRTSNIRFKYGVLQFVYRSFPLYCFEAVTDENLSETLLAKFGDSLVWNRHALRKSPGRTLWAGGQPVGTLLCGPHAKTSALQPAHCALCVWVMSCWNITNPGLCPFCFLHHVWYWCLVFLINLDGGMQLDKR